jgi:hypothetical protein
MSFLRADTSLVQGEDASLRVEVKQSGCASPFDLTGYAGATASFPGTTATVSVTDPDVSLVSAPLGVLSIPIPRAKTALMKAGEGQDWQLTIDHGPSGATRTILQFRNGLDVFASLF